MLLFFSIILFFWLMGGNSLAYAQQQGSLPTIKVKKKAKQSIKIPAGRQREKVQDKYKRPKTKSAPDATEDHFKPPRTRTKSGKIKDHYRKPPSKSHDEKVRMSAANQFPSPPVEEGNTPARPSLWNRIFRRHAPSTYQGKLKTTKNNNEDGSPGTSYKGAIKSKKIDFGSLSRDVQTYEGNLKTRQSKQKAAQAALFEGKLRRSIQRQEIRRYQQLTKSKGNDKGNVRVPVPRFQSMRNRRVSRVTGNSNGPVTYKRYSRKGETRHQNQTSQKVNQYAGDIKVSQHKNKAGDYSFYGGSIRTRTARNQTRYFKRVSDKVHQFNGYLRVRKAGKDMHPSVSYLKSKTKNSYEQKERYRKWMLKWHHWFKSSDQHKNLKTKSRKPRYDNKEKEIWYY